MRDLVTATKHLAAVAACFIAVLLPLTGTAGADIDRRLGHIALPFIENAGQYDAQVRFAATTFAGTLFVTGDGRLVYGLRHGGFTESFGDRNAPPVAGSRHVTRTNHFIGADRARHRTGVATYEDIAFDDAFPGVDVRLRATGANVEKIFTVRPGENPRAIRMHVDGARALRIRDDGALVVALPTGDIVFTPPVAYQTSDGNRIPIRIAYAVEESNAYGFEVGAYDRDQPLVIDPLLQATYLGGMNPDGLNALAVHPLNGQVYAAGYTYSTDFPCTTALGICHKGAGSEASGDQDVFIARFDAALTTLLQATYLGGSGIDVASALTFNSSTGEVLVGGRTNSANFPCTSVASGCVNGAQPSVAGTSTDGFIARLSANLEVLSQATYFGGSAFDTMSAIAFNPGNGEIIVAGRTDSTNLPCVTVATAGCGTGPQTTTGGSSDGFIARFNSTLTAYLQATYIGGSGYDEIFALAVHPLTGHIYAAGDTDSTNLPLANAFQASRSGIEDGFIVRLDATLTTRLSSTYFGRTGEDSIRAITIHPASGHVLVAGRTTSTDLPGACSSGCVYGGGLSDGFVSRLNASLTSALESRYLGGGGDDFIRAIAVSAPTGDVYVAGETTSTNFTCATAAGICAKGARSTNGGGTDAFVSRYDSTLANLLQSSYYGSGGTDRAVALAVHPVTGAVFIGGTTNSADLPCMTAIGTCANGGQSAYHGGEDAFIARFTPDLADASFVNFDIDAGAPDTRYDAATDGLLIMRYLFGLRGTPLVTGVVSPTANRSPDAIPPYLDAIRQVLDVDDNGAVDPLTDGVLILRHMLGLSGSALTNGAIGPNAARASPEAIKLYLQVLSP